MTTIPTSALVAFIVCAVAVGVAVSAVVFYFLGRRDDLGFDLGLKTCARVVSRAVAAVTTARLAEATPVEAAALTDMAGRIRAELSEIGVNS